MTTNPKEQDRYQEDGDITEEELLAQVTGAAPIKPIASTNLPPAKYGARYGSTLPFGLRIPKSPPTRLRVSPTTAFKRVNRPTQPKLPDLNMEPPTS